jgi:hypothetical protein
MSVRGAKYPNFQSPLSGGVERIFACLSSQNHGNKSIRRGSDLDLFSGFSPEYGEQPGQPGINSGTSATDPGGARRVTL